MSNTRRQAIGADHADHGDRKPADEGPLAVDVDRQAVDWFVRLQAQGDQPPTARAFRAWLESDPRHAVAFETVTALWGAPELSLAASNVARETGFVVPAPARGASRLRKSGTGCAVILVALGIACGPDMLLRIRADYVTEVGQRRAVTLPDGSAMTLNADSAVALDFSGGRRDVSLLEGEAYFDVRSDPAHPFRVSGRFGRVEVKGTAFDLKTEGDTDTVVLDRGRIEVARRASPADRVVLVAGEAVRVTDTDLLPVEAIDPSQSVAWLAGRISFSNRPFGQVLNDLRRYYPGRIFVTDRRIEAVAVSGNYRLDQPDLVVRSLADAAGASVTTLPGRIMLVH